VRIRISRPEGLRRLQAFLTLDTEAIVTPLDEYEIEISFLGSRNEWAQRKELELRLRSWLASHPEIVAVVSD
jgi:hypothetical protein